MLKVTAATHDLAVANVPSPTTTEAASSPSSASATEPASSPSSDPDSDPDEVDWSQVEVTLTEAQTRQFVTLYEALQGFDDRAAQAMLTCPRLCFVGSADEITYDERWGGVRVSMADRVISHRTELESLGWQVQVLDGLDHTQAMQAPNVLPILRPWLLTTLSSAR
jgi:hypothetical protein